MKKYLILTLLSYFISTVLCQDDLYGDIEISVDYFDDCTQITPNYNMHAFYYPWYGSQDFDGYWRHWNHKTLPHWTKEINDKYPIKQYVPPEDIGSPYYPKLGPYSCSDPQVKIILM